MTYIFLFCQWPCQWLTCGIDLGGRNYKFCLCRWYSLGSKNTHVKLQCILQKCYWRYRHLQDLWIINQNVQTDSVFSIGRSVLKLVIEYLGILFDYKCSFIPNLEHLPKSYTSPYTDNNNFKIDYKNLGLNIKEKQERFYSCVVSITDYSSSVRGFKKFQS